MYNFFWGDFCDWYIELMKPRLSGENAADPAATRTAFNNILAVFEGALRLLHPFMPFITEEIWQAIYNGRPPTKSISLAPYPAAVSTDRDAAAETEMTILQDLIVSVRNVRAELKIEPRQRVPVEIHAAREVRTLVEENRNAIERLSTVDGLRFSDTSLAKMAGARTTTHFEVRVLYEKQIDAAAERERLQKELEKLEREMGNAHRQLGNRQFLEKAPPNVVEGLRKRAQELELLRDKARGALGELVK